MYLELFRLKELPFRLSPDPQFLYLSKQHARARAFMESTVWLTDGFVIITGEIGSGKTTLIESFLKDLPHDVVLAQINQTQVSVIDFLQTLLAQFGFSPFQMKKAELIATLNNFLVEQYAAGRRVLLIVDEAQNLPLRVLEEIRMLSGVETTKDKVLRIILAGQPELNGKLDAPEMVQLAQRVRLRFHLGTLPEAEVPAYIQHRLDVAGAEGREIFAPDSYPLMFRYTGGVPRLVNILCDTAMLAAFGADRDHVLLEDVENSIRELNWVEFSARPGTMRYQPDQPPRGGPDVRAAAESLARHAHSSTRDILPEVVGRVIVANEEGNKVQEMELSPGRIFIGRIAENDLQIDSHFISRHHCQITTTAQGSVIEDLNSTNGLRVHGRRVRRWNLNDGDIVSLGSHELMYVDERLARVRIQGNSAHTTDLPALEATHAGQTASTQVLSADHAVGRPDPDDESEEPGDPAG